MATEHVRLDFNDDKNQIDLKSTSGDPWKDLQIILQGLALCMAMNVDHRKLNPDHLTVYVKQEIDSICRSREKYTVKNHNKKPPILLMR